MVGIYKITSPSGRIYVGQSRNIENRFKGYFKLRCKTQPKLYNSFVKYGIDLHVFEVVETCELKDLNNREQHYLKLFDCCSKINLNCLANHEPNYFTHDTIEKMRRSATGKISSLRGVKKSAETCLKMSLSKIGKPSTRKGAKLSEETKIKISKSKKGILQSDETKAKRIKSLTGLKKTHSKMWKVNGKKVFDSFSNRTYESISDAALSINMKPSTLRAMLRGQNKNKTKFIIKN